LALISPNGGIERRDLRTDHSLGGNTPVMTKSPQAICVRGSWLGFATIDAPEHEAAQVASDLGGFA
jgi:hypothetical protein